MVSMALIRSNSRRILNMQKKIYVYTFYRFKTLSKLKNLKKEFETYSSNKIIYGTILIANEGINGTISGQTKNIKSIINKLKKIFSFKEFDNSNNSKSKFQPFHKPKVKIKKEVVPMNLTINSRERNLNTHLNPKEWNDLIKKKDTHVIDTRKPFEFNVKFIGTTSFLTLTLGL